MVFLQPATIRKRIAVAASVIAVAAVAAGCSHSTSGGTAQSASPTAIPSAVAAKMTSPTACDNSAQNQSGSTWKIVMPRTLCGLPADNSPDARQNGQALLQTETLSFSSGVHPGIGTEKSSASGAWVTPSGVSPYRSINATGFTGSFNPSIVLKVLETSGAKYHTVSPGPHGGQLACSVSSGGTESCAFATSETAGAFTLGDTSGELDKGSHTNAIAAEIRDALEAPAG